MDLNQLRSFCAVARCGSFTQSAEQEGIAQPSLSRQIQRLERAVGAPLFERLGRAVRLTPAGEAFLPEAESILRRVAEAQAKVAETGEGVCGRLHLGVIPTVMPFWIAPRVRTFFDRFPKLEISMAEDLTQHLVSRMQSGEIDMAVASLPVHSPEIVCSELFREPLLLGVPADHPLGRAARVDLRELAGERLLLLKEGHCLRNDVLTACKRARTEFKSVFETDHLTSILALVASGFGVSIIPQMAAGAAAGCRLIPLAQNSVRRIGYLRVRRHFLSRAMKEFTAWLRASIPSPAKPR
jgi:LysR family hydrogen peroxide-inducible transcriptional activator